MKTIELGDKVKDPISGMAGIVTVRSEFLNGCIRVGIERTDKKKSEADNKTHYFDALQLEVVKKHVFKVKGESLIAEKKKKSYTGGPRPDPQRVDSAR